MGSWRHLASRWAFGCLALGAAMQPLAASACSHRRVALLPVDMASGLPSVTVQINGRPAHLYFDTGAQKTVLTERAVERLRLPPDWLGFQPVWGIGGMSMHAGAQVASIELGGLRLDARSVTVANFGQDWPGGSDGLLGDDILGDYDAEIDIGNRRIELYGSARCAAPAPGWKQPYSRMPIDGFQPFSRHVHTTVTVDGARLHALVDTGSERTIVGNGAVGRLGLAGARRGADIRMYGVGSRTVTYRPRRFATLELGGQVWRRPTLLVGALPAFMGEMLLGADFLATRKIWISWKNHAAFLARAHDKSAFKEPAKNPR